MSLPSFIVKTFLLLLFYFILRSLFFQTLITVSATPILAPTDLGVSPFIIPDFRGSEDGVIATSVEFEGVGVDETTYLVKFIETTVVSQSGGLNTVTLTEEAGIVEGGEDRFVVFNTHATFSCDLGDSNPKAFCRDVITVEDGYSVLQNDPFYEAVNTLLVSAPTRTPKATSESEPDPKRSSSFIPFASPQTTYGALPDTQHKAAGYTGIIVGTTVAAIIMIIGLILIFLYVKRQKRLRDVVAMTGVSPISISSETVVAREMIDSSLVGNPVSSTLLTNVPTSLPTISTETGIQFQSEAQNHLQPSNQTQSLDHRFRLEPIPASCLGPPDPVKKERSQIDAMASINVSSSLELERDEAYGSGAGANVVASSHSLQLTAERHRVGVPTSPSVWNQLLSPVGSRTSQAVTVQVWFDGELPPYEP